LSKGGRNKFPVKGAKRKEPIKTQQKKGEDKNWFLAGGKGKGRGFSKRANPFQL